MRCKLCGARIHGKNDHCTQCGAKVMRNPNAGKKLMMRVFLCLFLLIVLVVLFAVSMKIYDKAHKDDSLLPGLYTGMTKQEMIKTLQKDYPVFYNGKQMRNPNVENTEDALVYVAYTDYSNVLGLNRAVSFEATFYTIGNTQFLDTYTISIPYITDTGEGSTHKTAVYDIQTKVIPMLEERYGKSEDAGGDITYLTHFNIKESVMATDSTVSKLVGYQDALLKEFSSYEPKSFCLRITYEGYCFSKLQKNLSG